MICFRRLVEKLKSLDDLLAATVLANKAATSATKTTTSSTTTTTVAKRAAKAANAAVALRRVLLGALHTQPKVTMRRHRHAVVPSFVVSTILVVCSVQAALI